MPVSRELSVEEFAALLKGRGRLLGLDLGSKTIGLAISDDRWRIAAPVKTLRRTKFSADAAELAAYAQRESVVGLVMGMPFHMDGSEGRRAQSTRAFIRNLRPILDLPVLLWDERLSTAAANEAMRDAAIDRRKRAEKVDQIAASIILQGALERLREIQ